jgi:UDP:flavonoid glycosyltransferase YjiC (YdhE family)
MMGRPMRVLFSSTAGYGHVHPLVPLACAFADAGHEVSFATARYWQEHMEARGFTFLAAGLEPHVIAERAVPHRKQIEALPVPERRPHAFAGRFARIEAPDRIADVRRAVQEWQPDLLVYESGDLTAPIVAAEHGLPAAHHSFGRLVPLACFELAAVMTEPLWRAAGLEPEPYGGVFRGVYVDICPPSLASEQPPDATRVELLRPTPRATNGSAPEWLPALPDRPLVYVTLGTVFNELALFRVLLDALADLDCNVVATVGSENDPAALGPLPANARVERFVPQAELLPHCSVVVSHGGSGSTLGALAHGIPVLLVPRGADQFDNANACAAAGVARVLMPADLGVETVREAVVALLEDASYSTGAQRLAAEMDAMPEPGELVPVLLAATRG